MSSSGAALPLCIFNRAGAKCAFSFFHSASHRLNTTSSSNSSDILWREGEVNVRRDGNVEGALFVGLISRGHDDVAVWVAIQHKLLVVEAPRHELQRIFIQYVVFRWLNVSRVNIETDHGSHEGHSDLFLPGLLWPAQRNFDRGGLASLKLEKELRVLQPGESIRLRLKLLVVEMATTRTPLLPGGGEHDVAAVS